MNGKSIIATILLLFGLVILTYPRSPFNALGESLQLLGFKMEMREVHFIPHAIGELAVLGGFGMLFLKPRLV